MCPISTQSPPNLHPICASLPTIDQRSNPKFPTPHNLRISRAIFGHLIIEDRTFGGDTRRRILAHFSGHTEILRTCRADQPNIPRQHFSISNFLPIHFYTAFTSEGFGTRLQLHGNSTNHCLPCNPSCSCARLPACRRVARFRPPQTSPATNNFGFPLSNRKRAPTLRDGSVCVCVCAATVFP